MPRLYTDNDVLSRFHTRYSVDENSGCWIWTGPMSSDGYGIHHKVRAHRYSLSKLSNVDVKSGMVCHRCNNPLCVNPDHLYVGTPKDNTNDSIERGTFKNLHDGRDRFWSTKNKDERSQITKNGADGVRKYHASLSKEEKSERARKAARSRWSKP